VQHLVGPDRVERVELVVDEDRYLHTPILAPQPRNSRGRIDNVR
jgi:hypothetical protein